MKLLHCIGPCLLFPRITFSVSALNYRSEQEYTKLSQNRDRNGEYEPSVVGQKLSLSPEEPRHEEIEKRPEFQNVVLDWRSAQYDSMLTYELLSCFRNLRFSVPNYVT